MTFYFSGDIHGNPTALPALHYKKDDTLFILGDFGVPFGVKRPTFEDELEDTITNLKYLKDLKVEIIVVAGNHDDRDFIKSCLKVNKYGAELRQMVFQDIFYEIYFVDKPSILTIKNKTFLCIPGAESHDCDIYLDPKNDFFYERYWGYCREGIPFRIEHWDWWENEAIDIEAAKQLLKTAPTVDYILTHDFPTELYNIEHNLFKYFEITEGQKLLEEVRCNTKFSKWYHGHAHLDLNYPTDNRLYCLFEKHAEEEE